VHFPTSKHTKHDILNICMDASKLYCLVAVIKRLVAAI
jgi:hypothetical protein